MLPASLVALVLLPAGAGGHRVLEPRAWALLEQSASQDFPQQLLQGAGLVPQAAQLAFAPGVAGRRVPSRPAGRTWAAPYGEGHHDSPYSASFGIDSEGINGYHTAPTADAPPRERETPRSAASEIPDLRMRVGQLEDLLLKAYKELEQINGAVVAKRPPAAGETGGEKEKETGGETGGETGAVVAKRPPAAGETGRDMRREKPRSRTEKTEPRAPSEKKGQEPEMPKRPLSAWLRYVAAVREELPGKVGGKEAFSLASERWKAMDEADRKPYTDPYDKEKAEYDKVMAAYNEAHGQDPKKAPRSPRRAKSKSPKKAPSPYILFRRELREESPELSMTEASKLALEKWGDMTEEEKAPYEERVAEMRKEYESTIEEQKAPKEEPEAKVEEMETELSSPGPASGGESANAGLPLADGEVVARAEAGERATEPAPIDVHEDDGARATTAEETATPTAQPDPSRFYYLANDGGFVVSDMRTSGVGGDAPGDLHEEASVEAAGSQPGDVAEVVGDSADTLDSVFEKVHVVAAPVGDDVVGVDGAGEEAGVGAVGAEVGDAIGDVLDAEEEADAMGVVDEHAAVGEVGVDAAVGAKADAGVADDEELGFVGEDAVVVAKVGQEVGDEVGGDLGDSVVGVAGSADAEIGDDDVVVAEVGEDVGEELEEAAAEAEVAGGEEAAAEADVAGGEEVVGEEVMRAIHHHTVDQEAAAEPVARLVDAEVVDMSRPVGGSAAGGRAAGEVIDVAAHGDEAHSNVAARGDEVGGHGVEGGDVASEAARADGAVAGEKDGRSARSGIGDFVVASVWKATAESVAEAAPASSSASRWEVGQPAADKDLEPFPTDIVSAWHWGEKQKRASAEAEEEEEDDMLGKQMLAGVVAKGRGASEEKIVIPAEWAHKIESGSVLQVSKEGAVVHCRARLKSNPDMQVAFQIWATRDTAAARVGSLAELFMRAGVGPRVLARRATPDLSFLATEDPGDRALWQLIKDQDHGAGHGGSMGRWSPVVPLFMGLPLMVDMLRHLVAMDEVGLVHGRLDDETIRLVDYDTRTVFTGIGASCSPTDAEGELSCELADGMAGTAFLHAPEMGDGVPTHISNNVWQLGLVFAKMLVGGDWLTREAARGRFDDATPEGRERIRKYVREEFSRRSATGFKGLREHYPDILRVVGYMLEKDPKNRLSVRRALKLMEDTARARGVQLGHRPERRVVPLDGDI